MSVHLNRSLSFLDVFAIALGQIIGSGIMVLIGIGIEFTAYAIPMAFVLSATLSVIKQLPVAFMGSAMPATGGLYVYCKRVLGPRVGFFYLAILLITHILIALFALGFAEYAAALIPQVNVRAVAAGILVVFYIVNLFGVKPAAIVQKFMIVFLLIGLSTLIFSAYWRWTMRSLQGERRCYRTAGMDLVWPVWCCRSQLAARSMFQNLAGK